MGFFKELGSTIVNTATNSFKQGVTNGILSATKGAYSNSLGDIPEQAFHRASISSLDMSNSILVRESSSEPVATMDSKSKVTKYATENGAYELNTEVKNSRMPNKSYSLMDSLTLPDWGYDMFINERASFQKGLSGPTGDPGFFYFKIFFNFNTNYGLFGGILNSDNAHDPYMASVNTAVKYLYQCRNNYKQEKMVDRMNALVRFTKILSFINSQSPWFFKGISGLDKANVPLLEDFSKEKYIEIDCMEDAIDMRLTTLMDLYKFAAYDEYSNKEIIPENLRKFDMSVLLFASPIKYLHTSMKDSNDKNSKPLKYKGFKSLEYSNMPSFKLYTFLNCEITLDSIATMIPASMSNEQPFQLGKSKIRIQYDRVYTHSMNEFNRILFGTTGIYYDEYHKFQTVRYSSEDSNEQQKRYSMLQQALSNVKGSNFDVNKNVYKNLIDASEAVAHTNLTKLTGYSLGNIYHYETKPGSTYWKKKTNWQLGTGIPVVQDIGTDFLLRLFNTHYDSSARLHTSQSGMFISDDGWLPEYGKMAVGSKYWEDKVKSLKTGVKQESDYSRWVRQVQDGNRFNWSQSLRNILKK